MAHTLQSLYARLEALVKAKTLRIEAQTRTPGVALRGQCLFGAHHVAGRVVSGLCPAAAPGKRRRCRDDQMGGCGAGQVCHVGHRLLSSRDRRGRTQPDGWHLRLRWRACRHTHPCHSHPCQRIDGNAPLCQRGLSAHGEGTCAFARTRVGRVQPLLPGQRDIEYRRNGVARCHGQPFGGSSRRLASVCTGARSGSQRRAGHAGARAARFESPNPCPF
jgi:hypothetical protein